MLSEMGVRSTIGGGGAGVGGNGFASEDLEKDIGLLLREQRRLEAIDRERELSIIRSGSAPPTVEGALTAMGGVFGREVESNVTGFMECNNGNEFLSEEELRSSPSYLSYYYSHVNLNPRLPPPVLSKEDWRTTQRLQIGTSAWGGIGDRRKMSRVEEENNRSLFSMQPSSFSQEEHMIESKKLPGSAREWLDEGNGLMGLSLGRQKSFADVLQDDLGHRAPVTKHPSRPSSRNAFLNDLHPLGSACSQHTVNNEFAQQNDEFAQSVKGKPNAGASPSLSFASVVGSSHKGSSGSDAQLIARAPSPSLPPVGARTNTNDKKANTSSSSFNGPSSGAVEPDELIAAMSSISLSTGSVAQSKFQPGFDEQNSLFASQSVLNGDKANHISRISDPEYLHTSSFPVSMKLPYSDSARSSGSQVEFRSSGSKLNEPLESQRFSSTSANTYFKGASPSAVSPGGSPHYQNVVNPNMTFTSYGQNSYSINPALTSMMGNQMFEGAAAASAITSFGMNSMGVGGDVFAPPSLTGTTNLQTFSRLGNQTTTAALQAHLNDPLYVQYLKAAEYTAQLAATFGNPSVDRGYIGNSYSDLSGIQKAYIRSLLQSQKQYDIQLLGKSGSLGHGYYSSPELGMPYQGSPLGGSLSSPVGPGSPLRLGEHNMHFSPNLRNLNGGVGSWHSNPTSTMDELFPSTLLEEFKSNKTRCSELADIASHVVEFSADQYGSRFIQQKLETATVEEKNMVFEEIMPHVLTLMTDVFGNYVVQKFFEHGSATQRRELADKLHGHVLTLSLQMYGCRVIQKAIEVVDLDQKTKLVLELDGHVMRCVRDQNGNHVIQKCIECVPQEAIQFIITTFYDQVVTLSTHPYGCRVIQRVLEHCNDPKTQQIVMDEILQSVCVLAQDQYGNYVVQHVLEHGKPHERSAIIKTLAGQIVQMSQQKFASNVVEKCLTFGSLEERQLLISEILGSTDENEPLQAMMKDQFANYVVQKVLETCDDQQRELILMRIKVHLNALKKYTYGKHIVARVEKLVAAGERRMGLQFS